MSRLATCLMFSGDQLGKAQEAMNLYCSLFPDSSIQTIEHYAANDTGPEGTVKIASFRLMGQNFMAMDSAAPHAFNFTPSVSIFADCTTEQDVRRIYDILSEGGQLLMPLDNYGFSELFGWVNDRFGVSWQINLGAAE